MIDIKWKGEGVQTDASLENANLNNISAETGLISSQKIGTGTLTRGHFDTSNPLSGPSTFFWGFVSNDPGFSATYTSTTETYISHGSGTRITSAITLEEGDVLRLHFNTYVKDGVLDGADLGPGIFRITLWWDIAGTYHKIPGIEMANSIAVRTPSAGAKSKLLNRRLGGSFIYIHTGAPITIAHIEAKVAMDFFGSSVTLDQGFLGAILVRH